MPEADESVSVPKTAKASWWRERGKPAVLGFVVWLIARTLYATLRKREEGVSEMLESVKRDNGGILVVWHGRTLISATRFHGFGFLALISLSRDGEIQNHIFSRMGYKTVRGSTGRGGVRAALTLSKLISQGGVLCFTPDGPRGPSGKVQEGVLFLAQRSGKAIYPCGSSASPRKLLGTWDRYLVPMPFARAALVFGEPIMVPKDATDEEKSLITNRIMESMNACQDRAELLVL